MDQTTNPAAPARTAAYQAWGVIIGLAPAALSAIFGPRLPPRNLVTALVVAAAFALVAALLRAVDWAGALAGFGVALTLDSLGGWRMFAVLFFVFVLTWAATRAGHARKLARALAEHPGGRTATQVAANVGLAAWLLAGSPVLRAPLAARLPAMLADALVPALVIAVLAEAAADTCSSEIGKAFADRTALVTTWKPVAPGTDGGVSWLGTLSALLAAFATAAVACALGVFPPWVAVVVAVAATLATFFDSLLGATLERRGWLNNDAVNLASTAAAAAFTPPLLFLMYRLAP